MDDINKYYNEIKRSISEKNEKDTQTSLENAYANSLAEIKIQIKQYLMQNEKLTFAQQLELKRLDDLSQQINQQLQNLYDTSYNIMYDANVERFNDEYLGIMYQVENQGKINFSFNMLNDDYIRKSIEFPVDGIKLSDRLYGKFLPQMQLNIKSAVTKNLINGNGYSGIADDLSDSLNGDLKHACLIARTEGGRIASLAHQDAQDVATSKGIQLEKKWVATLDERTRTDHQILDGQTVPIDKPFTYGNYTAMQPRLFGIAKEDINCRCDTITIVDGMSPDMRIDNMTKEFIEYKNYDDWKKEKIANGEIKPPTTKEKAIEKEPKEQKVNNSPYAYLDKIKTKADAEKHFIENLGFKNVDLKDFSLHSSKEIIKHVGDFYKDFPTLHGYIENFGAVTTTNVCGNANWHQFGHIKPFFNLNPNMYGTEKGILKEKQESDARKYNTDESLKGTIRHELTHLVEMQMTMKKYNIVDDNGSVINKSYDAIDKFRTEFYDGNKSIAKQVKNESLRAVGQKLKGNQEYIKENISLYAKTSPREYLAELNTRSENLRPVESAGQKIFNDMYNKMFNIGGK